MIDVLASVNSRPQTIMDPVKLSFQIVLDPKPKPISLPQLIIMQRFEEIHLHMNQNQCILLLEIIKTYLDSPPTFRKILFQDAIGNFETLKKQKEAQKMAKKAAHKTVLPYA